MKRVFCSALILLLGFSSFAFSFEEKFPADKSVTAIVDFMLTECPLNDGCFDPYKSADENFDYFFEKGKDDWIVPFCKALATTELKDYGYRVGSNGYWHNPITTAIRKENYKLAKEIISAAPDLVNMKDRGGQFDGAEPIRYAVEKDNLELVALMLKSIPDINKVVCATDKEEWEQAYGLNNILTYAKTEAMKETLLKAGCKTLIPYDGRLKESTVTDSNVNIRDAPGFSGQKIHRLNNGTPITVLGWDCYEYNIDGFNNGHWIYIQYAEGKKGYIWQKYIDNHAW